MKSEKFTQSTEAFNENVNNSMKWFQDSFAMMMEIQNTQFKFAYDAFYSSINYSMNFFNRPNFWFTNDVADMISGQFRKNMETISRMAQENMKTAIELNSQASSMFFSKETMDHMVDLYTKQVSAVVSFNQTALNNLNSQFEAGRSHTGHFTESTRKAFEANLQMMNDAVKEFMGSYNSTSNPYFESGKNIFGNLTQQMENAFTANMKLWTDMMKNYQQGPEEAKTEQANNASKKPEQKETGARQNKFQPVHA